MQVCQSYIQELKHTYPLQEIGPYIEECNERNLEGKFAEQDVRGIATSKGLIETKANLDGVSLNSYKLVKPKEIAFVPDTSRRGDKMSLGLNDSDKTYIVSSISAVFNVDKENILPNFLYLWFCRSEFDRYARFNSWGSAREAFSFEDMKRCKIPIPPIDVQRAIVNIYKCANEAKQIAEEADRLSREVCSALLQHVIIYQIRNAVRKINIADEYIKHIDIIQKHVAKRLHARKQYGFVDTKDLIEIAESLHFVEVNSDDAINSIAADHYISDPIYSLYSMLYHERWDDRDAATYCHQIFVDYEKGRKKLQKVLKQNFAILFVPLTKLYRGFCVLFRLLTFPFKRLFDNFDKSGKWEASIAAIAEIFALVNAVIEFVKHTS